MKTMKIILAVLVLLVAGLLSGCGGRETGRQAPDRSLRGNPPAASVAVC